MTKQTTPFAIAPFDASEYLENEEVIAEYLAAASEDANPEVCMRAVADIAKARKRAKLATAFQPWMSAFRL
jgi:probable addiction module antidote protein